MRIAADTNVLLRAILDDHPIQSPRAKEVLSDAEIIAISLTTLCEFVWVLRQGDRRSQTEVVAVLRGLLDTPNVVTDTSAVAAGIAMAHAGGDFADGVAAFEGRRLGGAFFVTFDRRAAALLERSGMKVNLLDSTP